MPTRPTPAAADSATVTRYNLKQSGHHPQEFRSMSNMQFYFAMGLPTLTTLASLLVLLADIRGLRADTREDTKSLRGEMKSLRDELRSDMRDLRSEVRDLRSDVNASVTLLTGKVLEHTDRISKVEQRLDSKA
jgi:hypothetical protein